MYPQCDGTQNLALKGTKPVFIVAIKTAPCARLPQQKAGVVERSLAIKTDINPEQSFQWVGGGGHISAKTSPAATYSILALLSFFHFYKC
jgi:hypothetical protein